MAEVKLGSIRIGFNWTADLVFPSGFLAAGESILFKWRRHLEDSNPVTCGQSRAGDTVTISLPKATTANMLPGTYTGEAIIYKPADPAYDKIPLTNNRYIAECDHSPSE